MCSASTSASANRRRRHASAWTLASVHALSVALFSIHGESSDRVMPPSVSNRTSCLTSWRVNLSRTPAPKPSPSRHRMRRRLERWLRHHFQIESRRFHRPREGRGRRPTDQRPSRNPHVRPQPRRDQQQPIGPLCPFSMSCTRPPSLTFMRYRSAKPTCSCSFGKSFRPPRHLQNPCGRSGRTGLLPRCRFPALDPGVPRPAPLID